MTNVDFGFRPQQNQPPPAQFPDPRSFDPHSPIDPVQPEPPRVNIPQEEPPQEQSRGGTEDTTQQDEESLANLPKLDETPDEEKTDEIKDSYNQASFDELPQQFRPHTGRDEGWGKDSAIRAAYAEDPSWGMTAQMPHMDEGFGVLAGASRQLGMFSSPAVAQPANFVSGIARIIGPWMDLIGKGAFGRGFDVATERRVRARKEMLEMEKERMMQYALQMLHAHRERLSEYDEVFQTYKNHGFGNDKESAEKAAEKVIYGILARENDGHLRRILDNGGLGSLYNQLKWEDAKFLDNLSAYTALMHWSRRSSFATGATTRGATRATKPEIPDPWLEGEGEKSHEMPLPFKGVSTEAPIGVSDPVPNTVPETDTSFDKELYDKYGKGSKNTGAQFNKDGIQAIKEWARTGTYQGATPAQIRLEHPKAVDLMQTAAQYEWNRINAIARNNALSQEEKEKAIGRIDPRIIEKAKDIADYSSDARKSADVPPNQRFNYENLAGLLDPSYKQRNYDLARKFYETNNPTSKSIAGAGNVATALVSVNAALGKFTERDRIPIFNIVEKMKNNLFSIKPEYHELYQALSQLAQAESVVTSLSGQPRQGIMNRILANLNATESQAQIRAQVMIEAKDVWGVLSAHQNSWSELGKKTPMPGMDPALWKFYSAYFRSDPFTGQMPDDAPSTLKRVSRNPKPTDTELQRQKPLNIDDYRKAHEAIKAIRENPAAMADDRYLERLKKLEYLMRDLPFMPLDPGEMVKD